MTICRAGFDIDVRKRWRYYSYMENINSVTGTNRYNVVLTAWDTRGYLADRKTFHVDNCKDIVAAARKGQSLCIKEARTSKHSDWRVERIENL